MLDDGSGSPLPWILVHDAVAEGDQIWPLLLNPADYGA